MLHSMRHGDATADGIAPARQCRDICAVVMAFNEVDTLSAIVHELDHVLAAMKGNHEILIVNDGSTDGTGPLADDLSREIDRVRVIHHGSNQGLGSVYRTGFTHARGDCLTFFPADGQFPGMLIPKFFDHMPEFDMVLGYSTQRRSSLIAKTLSSLEKLFFRLLFGNFPRFQSQIMLKRALLDKIHLRSPGGRSWTILMELVIRAHKARCRILRVPVEIRERLSGRSKVNNFRTIFASLKQAIVLRFYF